MKKILFVCLGNLERSQMAEAYYNTFSNSKNAYSAGTDKTSPQNYSHPSKQVIEIMKEESIDVSNQKVKSLREEMLNNINSVYVLCKKQECPNYLINFNNITFWNIEDPHEMNINKMRKIRNQIKEKVKYII